MRKVDFPSKSVPSSNLSAYRRYLALSTGQAELILRSNSFVFREATSATLFARSMRSSSNFTISLKLSLRDLAKVIKACTVFFDYSELTGRLCVCVYTSEIFITTRTRSLWPSRHSHASACIVCTRTRTDAGVQSSYRWRVTNVLGRTYIDALRKSDREITLKPIHRSIIPLPFTHSSRSLVQFFSQEIGITYLSTSDENLRFRQQQGSL